MEKLELDDSTLQEIEKWRADFSRVIPAKIRSRMVSIYEANIGYEIVKALYSHNNPVDYYTILDDLDSYVCKNNTSFMDLSKEFQKLIDDKIITKETRGPGDVVYSTNSLTNEAFGTIRILDKYLNQPTIEEMKLEAELLDLSEADLNNTVRAALIVTLKDFE